MSYEPRKKNISSTYRSILDWSSALNTASPKTSLPVKKTPANHAIEGTKQRYGKYLLGISLMEPCITHPENSHFVRKSNSICCQSAVGCILARNFVAGQAVRASTHPTGCRIGGVAGKGIFITHMSATAITRVSRSRYCRAPASRGCAFRSS